MKPILVILLMLSCVASSARAADDFDPLGAVATLGKLFHELDEGFEQFVSREKHGQLKRSVKKLSTELYDLEQRSKKLLLSLPEEKPSGEVRNALMTSAKEIMSLVQGLEATVRSIGADLRAKDVSGVKVDDFVFTGLYTRSMAVSYLETQLRQGQWMKQELAEKLEAGIKALNKAQVEVTQFYERLPATP